MNDVKRQAIDTMDELHRTIPYEDYCTVMDGLQDIDTCPFCGANLKAGGGDVLLVKADGGWWVVNGFLNESG